MRFSGKNALVTGASRGIGSATARLLAAEGAFVGLHCHRGRRQADALLSEIQEQGGDGMVLAADLSDAKACDALVAEFLEVRGGIDLLVNNAGLTKDGFAAMLPLSDWQQVLDVDLTAPFLICRAAAKAMMRVETGAIVNVSSTTAVSGRPGQTNYAAAKGGIIALSRSLALEVAQYGIRVNCVIPGFVETDMLRTLSRKHREMYQGLIPMGRFGAADEVAKAIAFLLSDDASYVHGQTLTVDGGMIH